MINFGFDPNNPDAFDEGYTDDIIEDGAFTESMIDDALKSTNAASKEAAKDVGPMTKLKNAENKTVGKAANTVNKLDRDIRRERLNNSSIIARARNSVLQFPVYVTQTIRVNEAHTISKLFERVYTTLVQTVLSQNQIISEDEANNLVFLKNFHSNLKEAADVFVNKYYEPIDDIDAIIGESVFFDQQINERCSVTFSVVPSIDKDLLLENTRLLNDPLSGFAYLIEADDGKASNNKKNSGYMPRYKTVNEQEDDTATRKEPLSNSDIEDLACAQANISDDRRRLAHMSESDIRKKVEGEMHGASKDDIDDEFSDRIAEKNIASQDIDDAVEKYKKEIKDAGENGKEGIVYYNGKYCRKSSSATRKITKGKNVDKTVPGALDAPKLLKDADIKKINGMLPYTIEAAFRLKDANGNFAGDVKYVIGIKSVLHLIRAQDLAEDLEEIITGNIKKLQKVRYKTGEITFKDYFLNIKGIKSDAMKHINYNKRWLNTLKRLGEYNKLNGTLLKKPAETLIDSNVPIPNGTLILSQLDVNSMVNETGIDISEVNVAKKLAKSLFLIGVVIVDSTAGSMRVLFPDSDNDWDVQSLAAIDSELTKTDNSQLMRELNKMVNR